MPTMYFGFRFYHLANLTGMIYQLAISAEDSLRVFLLITQNKFGALYNGSEYTDHVSVTPEGTV